MTSKWYMVPWRNLEKKINYVFHVQTYRNDDEKKLFESRNNMVLFNPSKFGDAFMCYSDSASLDQIMDCCLSGAKPLSEPVLVYCSLDAWECILVNCEFTSIWYHDTGQRQNTEQTWKLNNTPNIWHSWVSYEMNIFHKICPINMAWYDTRCHKMELLH